MDIMLKIAEYIPGRPYIQIVSVFTYAFFLWISIFLLRSNPRKQSSIMAGSAMLIIGIYVFFSTLLGLHVSKSQFVLFHKFYLAFGNLCAILWLHLTLILQLNKDVTIAKIKFPNYIYTLFKEIPTKPRSFLLIFYVIDIIGVLGSFTDGIISNYGATREASWPLLKWIDYYVPGSDFYLVFGFFWILTIFWSAINIFIAYLKTTPSGTDRKKMKMLLWGNILFLLTTIILSLTQTVIPIPDVVGHLILAIAILIVGYAIAKYNALVEGRIIKEKLLANFSTVSTFLAFLIFIVYISLNEPPIPLLLGLTTFVIISQAFYDNTRGWWEKRFLDPRISSVKISTERLAAKMSEINVADVETWIKKAKTLSEAERRIFDAIGKGLGKHGYDDISSELFVSKNTVDAHLKNIRKKLGCCKSAELPLVWLVVNFLPEQENRLVKVKSEESKV